MPKLKVTEISLERRKASIRALFGQSPQKGVWRPAKSWDDPYCPQCGLPENNCICGDIEDDDRPY